MEAVGLCLMEGTEIQPVFARSEMLPQVVAARVSLRRFSKVNTAKGRWAFIDELSEVPTSGSVAPAKVQQGMLLKPDIHGDVTNRIATNSTATCCLTVEDAQMIVHAAAVEVLGEGVLGSDLQILPGACQTVPRKAPSCAMRSWLFHDRPVLGA